MAEPSACAPVVVDALVRSGVREAVLAPGSRSAPLAYALHAADAASRLRLHVRLDERTAGFLALGLAKGSGAPVAVVTTSGTAPAHLHPAVLEAWHSHLPLVAVTADRPRALTHAGANQTTDQLGLFEGHVVADAHLDERDEERSWRFELRRLLTAATGVRSRRPGPVHLNVALSEPLTAGTTARPLRREQPVAAGPFAPAAAPVPSGPRTVIVAGDTTPERGREIARLSGEARLPLLAEPSSNARRGLAAIATYRLLLQTPLAEQIERVVVFGRPTLSRPVLRLLQREDVELIVVSPYADWVDPGLAGALVADAVELEPGDGAWLERWRVAGARVDAALASLLARQSVLSGPALAAALWTGLADRDVLVVGASSPIRDLDLAPLTPAPPLVYANRGVSGIDGTVSTAVGVALAAGRPTSALLGDLTLLHDATGLLVPGSEPRPDLRLVVANDDGGSLFATLEHGDPVRQDAFERLFGTPQGVDLRALAAATGWAHRRVTALPELTAALAVPPSGLELVEVVVDRAGRRALTEEVDALARKVLD